MDRRSGGFLLEHMDKILILVVLLSCSVQGRDSLCLEWHRWNIIRIIKWKSGLLSKCQLVKSPSCLMITTTCQFEIVYSTENFGETLHGDRLVNTMYHIKMGQPEQCKLLCRDEKLDKDKPISLVLTTDDGKNVAERIREDYFVHLLVNNLPCSMKFLMVDNAEPQYEAGYRLGEVGKDGKVYLNNHLRPLLKYHKVDESRQCGSSSGCGVTGV